MTLAEVLVGYYESHGKNIASHQEVLISARLWNEFCGEVAAADACEVERIELFKRWLSGKNYSPGYINRVLSVGRAALMRAYHRRLIDVRPIVQALPGCRGNPKGEPLSVAELQRLYAAFEEPHLRRFLILGLATGGRPDAIRGLAWTQIDLSSRCIRLNPLGRTQTKKRRAEVPVCDELAKILSEWGEQDCWAGPLVHFRGNAIASVKTAWRRARVRAGLSKRCNPYSLRHTVGKWLRSRSVPAWEVAALLGHKLPGYSITEDVRER